MSAEFQTAEQTAQIAQPTEIAPPALWEFHNATRPIANNKRFNLILHNGLTWSGWVFEYRRWCPAVRQVLNDFELCNIKFEVKECFSIKNGKNDDYKLVYIKQEDNPTLFNGQGAERPIWV